MTIYKGIVGVLYLAEVQKEKVFVGNPKTKVKLLACQRSEQNWTAVPNEEVVQAEEASKFNEGALVLVDLSPNKQVQRVQEAGRQLVSTLQNFSRLQEKFKTQEEEIEQWKQSLTYQSQELNRREMEMEARREQLQEMEDDFEKLEQQRQEIEGSREEINRLREEVERRKQDLEGAWEHLNGERRRFDELKGELQGKPVLDEAQARKVQEMLDRLSGSIIPIDAIREQLNLGLEVINGQQNVLNEYWQQLEQQRGTAQQAQDEVDRQGSVVSNRWQEWHQAQTTLEQARSELKAQQSVLTGKQEYLQFLESQRQIQEELHQQICRLAEGNSGIKLGGKVDLEALEKM
ncbi:MAG: pilus motility taxis protein HmpF, partial [Leptolyngbyaceae cyanobacterium bins.59]|nr:pilus motility taxis protein HmpF [Leptolyngbyaceae cyanobacterium bins.59]